MRETEIVDSFFVLACRNIPVQFSMSELYMVSCKRTLLKIKFLILSTSCCELIKQLDIISL